MKILEEGEGNYFDSKNGIKIMSELNANIKAPPMFQKFQKKPQTFEDFLQDKHAEGYMGIDDDMPDSYEHWCSSMDMQEVMDYAQEWGETLV